MSLYTTGELAKICGISVRTVQFYDTKDLLKPSQLSEGGRRLYTEEDAARLRLICVLKSLGLTLSCIREILKSPNRDQTMLLLLEEQAKSIQRQAEEKQKQLQTIRLIQDSIRHSERVPMFDICDIELMMNSKKNLRKLHAWMLCIGIGMDLIQIFTLILWILTGNWIPFTIGMLISIVAGILMTWLYYQNTDYICPECHCTFKPKLRRFLFSAHTPKTRKCVCPQCGYHGFCVETYHNK